MNPRLDHRWRAPGVPRSASRDLFNEQHLAVVNDEYRHCKINFFVDVGHCGKDCGKRAGMRQTLHCVGSIPGKGICRRPAMTCLWRIESYTDFQCRAADERNT